MKAYTDLEQSKKLAEILPLETADMAWYSSYAKDGYTIRMLNDAYPLELIGEEHDDIPAWSLSALLGLIECDYNLEKTLFDQSDLFTYSIVCDVLDFRTYEYDDPIDAAFEMVCWLKENGKI